MTTVRIYQPSKVAMQSGKGKTKKWCMKFETKDPVLAEPLTGWISSQDTSQQLYLSFPSLEEALRFAKEKGFHYTVYNPTLVLTLPKNYALNFMCPRIRGS